MTKKKFTSVEHFLPVTDKMREEAGRYFSRDYFRQQGKKGGKIGGKRAAALLSPAQRKARATKASKAAALARTTKTKKGPA